MAAGNYVFVPRGKNLQALSGHGLTVAIQVIRTKGEHIWIIESTWEKIKRIMEKFERAVY